MGDNKPDLQNLGDQLLMQSAETIAAVISNETKYIYSNIAFEDRAFVNGTQHTVSVDLMNGERLTVSHFIPTLKTQSQKQDA